MTNDTLNDTSLTYADGSCLQSRHKVSARSKHLRRLIQVLIYWMRRLFMRTCRHEYHAHYHGGRWRDAKCVKCGKIYPTWRMP